jgi:uncharacterized paraquat-inducible protein A
VTCWSCQAENDLSERQTCARCGAPLMRSSGVFQKSLLVGIVVALVLLQLVCVLGGILR